MALVQGLDPAPAQVRVVQVLRQVQLHQVQVQVQVQGDLVVEVAVQAPRQVHMPGLGPGQGLQGKTHKVVEVVVDVVRARVLEGAGEVALVMVRVMVRGVDMVRGLAVEAGTKYIRTHELDY